jgi:hypothetical protein
MPGKTVNSKEETMKLTKQGLNSEETSNAKTASADTIDRNYKSGFQFRHLFGFHNV